MNVEYDQPTVAPVPKMIAVGKANLIATGVAALVTLLALFGVVIPMDVSADAVAVISGCITLYSLIQSIYSSAAGYLKKDAKPVEAVQAIQKSVVEDPVNSRG